MLLNLQRITKAGIKNFWRNGWISTATVSIMVLMLSMVVILILSSVLTQAAVVYLQNKIDISVYFKPQTLESEILKLKNELSSQPQVKNVDYVSEDEALVRFKKRHQDNTGVIESLDELGGNPLEASLNIKAKNPDDFAGINKFLESTKYDDIISDLNYDKNKGTIDKLKEVISVLRKIGFAISLVLAFIAILVSFNTIRITIYTSRDEIGIMKLVGATNWFVRGPFLVEGALYGIVSSILTILIFYPIVSIVAPYTDKIFQDSNLLSYFQGNILTLWLILFCSGVTLGVFGSFIAVRRYLNN